MKLITYQYQCEARIGAELHGWIVDLNRAHKATLRYHGKYDELVVADARVPTNMMDFLNGGEASLEAARQALAFVQEQTEVVGHEKLAAQGLFYEASEVTYLPPVLRPGKVICVGVNYYSLAEGAGEPIPDYPILFHKTATPLIGNGDAIVLPPITNEVAPEGELAFVIGKRGKYIPESEAISYIAGYTCVNDVTAKDIEFRTPQWSSGKMLDTFCPLGPALITRDEIAKPNDLELKTILNGVVIQHGNTDGMIFNIPKLVSYISSIATLEPGDVILTGTPSDLGLRSEPILLAPGDMVSVEIEGVGVLTNPVVAEVLREQSDA